MKKCQQFICVATDDNHLYILESSTLSLLKDLKFDHAVTALGTNDSNLFIALGPELQIYSLNFELIEAFSVRSEILDVCTFDSVKIESNEQSQVIALTG
jgi:hypothetical protein